MNLTTRKLVVRKINIKVQFFEDRLVDAVGVGVYEIYAKIDNKEELFYVGESVFVLVRCATHWYEISKGKGYLGFTEEMIEKDNITLIFFKRVKISVSRSIAMPTLTSFACSLSRHSPYASELEYVCL